MKGNFVSALAVLIGTIIGAGIFGIPYVISRSGVITGLFYFFVLGAAVLLIHLFFGEIVLRTEGKYRIIGYAKKYLGRGGKLLVIISTVTGLVGSLLAYAIIAGEFMGIVFSFLLPSIAALSSFSFTIFFLISLSFFIFRGIKIVAPTEILTNILFLSIIFAILFFSLPKVSLQNFSLFNPKNLFLPYGVIMFAMIGWTAIPEMCDLLKGSEGRRRLKKIIILGTVFPILIYAIFTFAVLGATGKNTSPESLQGLIPVLGNRIVFFGALAAIVTLIDSFIIIGLSLKNSLIYDLKIKNSWAALLTCALPLILFLIGFREFINIIGFIGTILGVIDGIIIILIFKRAKKLADREPEYSLKIPSPVIFVLASIFVFGAASQIFYYFN